MRAYSRREFIGRTVAASAALLAPTSGAPAATRRNIPIGVQLYSVRAVFPGDIPGTLAGIKKIGFEGVEFAGYFSFEGNAKGLRKVLDDTGLRCCGTHIGLETMQGDALEKTVEFNQILGNSRLVVPSSRARTIDDWKQLAGSFNEVAEKLKPHKMRIGYHNHAGEFQAVDGQIPEDVFFGQASQEVFVQLDIGHCARAGGDPVAYLKKFPGRVLSTHVKEYSPSKRDAVPGEGVVKWAEVLDACAYVAGTEWHIIEEESGAFRDLDGIAKSYQGLLKLLG